jgi:hypothetical protein
MVTPEIDRTRQELSTDYADYTDSEETGAGARCRRRLALFLPASPACCSRRRPALNLRNLRNLWILFCELLERLYSIQEGLTTSRPYYLCRSKSMKNIKKKLSPEQREELIKALKARFEKNMNRHKGLEWAKVQAKLQANPEKLWSLNEMETTGGEPDVVGSNKKTGQYVFYDCSAESPKGRRSVCYDREALDSRKEHKPENNAIDMAAAMGIELLSEEQYRELQKLGNFDTKTSSWIKTPSEIRKLGGAIFCDRRYDHVFVYHNGAESYYAARGFRGSLRV